MSSAPGDANAVGPGNTLGEPLSQRNNATYAGKGGTMLTVLVLV